MLKNLINMSFLMSYISQIKFVTHHFFVRFHESIYFCITDKSVLKKSLEPPFKFFHFVQSYCLHNSEKICALICTMIKVNFSYLDHVDCMWSFQIIQLFTSISSKKIFLKNVIDFFLDYLVISSVHVKLHFCT